MHSSCCATSHSPRMAAPSTGPAGTCLSHRRACSVGLVNRVIFFVLRSAACCAHHQVCVCTTLQMAKLLLVLIWVPRTAALASGRMVRCGFFCCCVAACGREARCKHVRRPNSAARVALASPPHGTNSTCVMTVGMPSLSEFGGAVRCGRRPCSHTLDFCR